MITRTALALAAATLAAQPLLAQAQPAAPAAPARPAPPTPQQQEAVLRQLGFSAAGIAAIEKNAATDRAAAEAAAPDLRAGRAALVAAAQATPFNAAKFEQMLRNQQVRVDRLTAIVAGNRASLLRSLPPVDQPIFAKLLVLGPPRPSASPGAPVAPPPPPPPKR